MTHRHLTAAAALAACTALLLTGCGGDDGTSTDDDKIAGAEQSDKAASPSESSGENVDRPDIKVPDDVKFVVEGADTGDEDKDAALHDAHEFLKATHMAIARSDPDDKAYQFYSTGKPAVATHDWIQWFADNKQRTTGTTRYFNHKVSVDEDGWASMTFCEDQSKSYNKDLKTGKIDVTSPSEDSYIGYSGLSKKNEDGVWVIEKMTTTRGAEHCQP